MKKLTFAASAAALFFTVPALAQTEIEWWHAHGGQLGETVNAIANKFNESQSEIVLTPVYKGGYEDTLTATIAAFRAGEQPNIVQVFDAGAATIIGAEGAVIPAEDLIQQAGIDFDANDYISGVRYFYADSDGKMVGMPFNSSTPILYYNVAALEKAGVEPPKTWEEFEAIAPKIVEAGYIPLAQSHSPWIFTENFHSRHNIPFATNNNGFDGSDGTKILVNNDAIKMHFSKVKEWLDGGWYGYYGAGWGDNQTPFENQEVAMWLGSSGSFGGLLNSADFEFSATYLPYWESVTANPTQTFIGGAALFALSGHSDEENKASAEFFKFLSSTDIQQFWHTETGYVPITTAAYEATKASGYYQEKPQAEVGILQLSLPGGDNSKGYRMGFYVQIRDVMNREYGRIFAGETDVESAFAVIEEEGNQLLERFSKTN
ncbi:extracellular solute-binding protein [Ruegeria arenilitoris]|uniref:extracellular solute-binding protein n=1 Tax=Ruegeria arenilitoris TaxID=1173585 RepID=UPI0014816707|nr:extracellular solute-binding protein [Ruegeria arenilitoris]